MWKHYSFLIKHLHTATVSGKKAPHKAILVLSVIELVEEGIIYSPCFELSDDLINRFYENWDKFVKTDVFKPEFTTPYWHLRKERFWKLNTFDGSELKLSYLERYLKQFTFAIINPDLFDLLQKRKNSHFFKELIKDTYLI